MSTSFTPSKDLLHKSVVPQTVSPFTTFTTGHFVKPSSFTQPVKAMPAEAPATFAGCYTETFFAAPIDLDYDEPNAVVEADLELVTASDSVHQIELPVVDGLATNESPAVSVRGIETSKSRTAA